jgi:hypothetical protein
LVGSKVGALVNDASTFVSMETGGGLVGATFPTLGDDMTVGSPSPAGAIGVGTCRGTLCASADAAISALLPKLG